MMKVKDIPLIGGHPVLDFSNSWENPGLPNEVNYLPDYAAFAGWALRVDLLRPVQARNLLGRASKHPVRARAAWEKAVALRRHLLAILHAVTSRRDASTKDLEAVNIAIAEALESRCLVPTSQRTISWSWKDPVSVDVIFWEIALLASDLLTNGKFQNRIRTCSNGHCGWVFLDLSHAGRRRWCRMGVCGSVNKVRRFRERQRSRGSKSQ